MKGTDNEILINWNTVMFWLVLKSTRSPQLNTSYMPYKNNYIFPVYVEGSYRRHLDWETTWKEICLYSMYNMDTWTLMYN